MKTMGNKLLTAALVLLLLLQAGCAGAGAEAVDAVKLEETALLAEEAEQLETAAEPEPERAAEQDLPVPAPDPVEYHAGVDYADMDWHPYDMTEFTQRAQALAAAEDLETAGEEYQWLYRQYALILTMGQLAWIEYYSDVDSQVVYDACQTLDAQADTAYDSLCTALSQVLAGPLGEEFAAAWLDEDLAQELSEYQQMDQRTSEILSRESELQLEYNRLMARTDLSAPELNSAAGKIFQELVQLRNEMASLQGYESFPAYAYEAYYGRDYTPEDAAALCQVIKPLAREYFQAVYSSNVFWDYLGPDEEFSAEELMNVLRNYAPGIAPEAVEAQAYLEEHGLYLMEDWIMPLGFVTDLYVYGDAFLYNSLYGNLYDLSATIHEFGHYVDAYSNPRPNVLGGAGSYDIFEIHSTGLEALFYGWYDEICGSAADAARIYCLDSLLYSVVTGCILDEFQQYVYANPDMSIDEINQVYASICQEYGMPFWSQESYYDWMYVNHNFESPLYYISYAASSLASLQIWELAETDRQAAIELYVDLLHHGAFDMGYCELLEEMGLSVFSDGLGGSFLTACRRMEELCLAYQEAQEAA